VGCWQACFNCSKPQAQSILAALFDQNIQSHSAAYCKVWSEFVLKTLHLQHNQYKIMTLKQFSITDQEEYININELLSKHNAHVSCTKYL